MHTLINSADPFQLAPVRTAFSVFMKLLLNSDKVLKVAPQTAQPTNQPTKEAQTKYSI